MINRLSGVLEKKGQNYINSMLSSPLVITEKIDTFRILFERVGDDIVFYKKNGSLITIIDRTLTDLYEEAINEIPLIVKKANIPPGYFFGLYYTPTERPLRIPYAKIPKYILTDVSKREHSRKITERLSYDEVKKWASELCMGRPPIIFEGILSKEQQDLLLAYDAKSYDGRTLTFSSMIENLFGKTYSQEDLIEGIVIQTDKQLSQVISYEFDILNETYNKDYTFRDFYDILIIDINNSVKKYNIPVLEGKDKDQLYIDTICEIFNNYCADGFDINSLNPKYLTPPQYGYANKINKNFIRNKKTLKHLNNSPVYEALFNIFLSSFRKRKKPYGLLNESIVSQFNEYVNIIQSYVNNFDDSILYEDDEDILADEDISQENINEVRSDNIVIDALKKRKPNDIDNMRVISSIQKAFEPRTNHVEKGTQPCAIYLTTLEPFTSAQLINIERINKMWNMPVLICAISESRTVKGEDFHLSDNIVKAQMQMLVDTYPDLIKSYFFLKTWSLIEIFEFARPTYEPMVIITDEGKKSEMAMQLFFEEEIMGKKISVDDKFNIGEMPNEDKLLTYRAIEDGNYVTFKELTPPCIHNIFQQMFAEYRLWSGQVLNQNLNTVNL